MENLRTSMPGDSVKQNKDIDWVLYFDDKCRLCSGMLRFLRKTDPGSRIKIAPLSSAHSEEILRIDKKADSIILSNGSQYFVKSQALIEVFRILGGIWKLGLIIQWVPLVMRDAVYDFIARNRYRLQSKPVACHIPNQD